MSNTLQELDFNALINRSFTPSPSAWEDQVLYFLLIDRFSDNKESEFSSAGTRPMYQAVDNGNAVKTEADAAVWREAGGTWAGGTITGLIHKIPYLKNLGVSAIWISPVFKQVAFQDTYHGYGIQDFLEVDPHFGSKEGLQQLVREAHAAGIYIVLDIVVNHTGDVFSYDADRYLTTRNGRTFMESRWDDHPYRPKGFNDATGKPAIPFTPNITAGPDDAIWPKEFQDPAHFTQKGQITNWDYDPEYLQGDFFDLKDIHLGQGATDTFTASAGLRHLIEVYKYWIALLDIDGYRIDTVKHMETGAVRTFASAIHEFAQRIGKDNFYLIGEITGDRSFAFNKLEETGIDAALGIADVQQRLGATAIGQSNPDNYFNLFRNSILIGKESHTWFRNKVVVMVDDHDKVNQGDHKARFCAQEQGNQLIRNVLAANLTTLGIPCIYYGSEQGFDGAGSGDGADRYIREAMFGGSFGAFRSKDRHFFNTTFPVYREVAKIIAIRRQNVTLRRGRQYLREISGDGIHFGLPALPGSGAKLNSIIAWSRILDDEEILVVMNTDTNKEQSAWITMENTLHRAGDVFTCLYPSPAGPRAARVEERNGKALLITVPAAGFVIYKKE